MTQALGEYHSTSHFAIARRSGCTSAEPYRFVVDYLNTHSSWLNQIEMWFGTLSRKLLKRGSFCSVNQLRSQIVQFIEYYNDNLAKPYN